MSTHDRYPEIRPTSGYADPRVRSTGPGPGAGADSDPDRSSMLTARLAVVLSILVGQLWGLTVGLNAWMRGDTRIAWWIAGFEVVSFSLALVVWRAGQRRDR
ncbi:hypothetical protein F4553_002362 [Allocatelliglobosispora scoriae]|uniref:Uncharacterized protein n=1 Tax=Allocatelliglobosispora scoriae TaxID=643052 RepID=A0A841BPW4_9ACTN|nr:DUF6755 family protein [Allocatelliglobosispora scoriae]MBB5868983.1 hypothetical protein [Allocatelliglobosispora scoriae]